MNEQQKAMLDRQLKLQRGAAIIEGTQEKFRQDGYSNLLNKYGTAQDSSTSYQYNQEIITNDMELIRLYEGNGLFTKIIDRPSEEAVKHGFDIDFGDEDVTEYVDDRMDDLDFESKFATAEKWARLYGGSIIVMLVDDGRGLEEPLDWKNVRTIEELRVFERAIVQPDYTSMYHFHFLDTIDSDRPFAEPEYYQVFSIYGYFIVHRSRCLVFRNGSLPEQTTNAIYRYWGIPEYVKIKRALRECITSHENGTKLLERCVQAIYKMKNLANMLGTDEGEDKVLQRLQVIDMARSILNSIAIDSDGEDYDFKTFSMAGVKDVLDSTCNMLSAVTEIPQTILFGRSPAGMNATGENDMENYYNMVEKGTTFNGRGKTLTGSGPETWTHDHTVFGIHDLCGNVWEWFRGLRLMDGVLQVAENNDAAMNIDLSEHSQNWKPVMCEEKPIRLDCTEGEVTFTTCEKIDADYDGCRWGDVNFDCVQTQEMKELGLFPGEPEAYFYADTSGERLPICGGGWLHGAAAGVFGVALHYPRSYSSSYLGFRSAFYRKLETED